MKTTLKRWSLMFLVVITVLSMVMTIAPVAVSAAPENPCDTSIGCKLLVNIITPVAPTTIQLGDTFWVDATVAKPINIPLIADVTAELVLGEGAIIVEGYEQPTYDLDDCYSIVDFWWKVKCVGVGPTTITVNATSTQPLPESCLPTPVPDPIPTFAGTANVTVQQVYAPCDPKLVVTVIECGNETHTAIPNGPPFGVKALVTNVSDKVVEEIDAFITWEPEGAVTLISGPIPIHIEDLNPGESNEVGWTFQCISDKDVKFTVNATFTKYGGAEVNDEHGNRKSRPCEVTPDYCNIDQLCKPAGTITLSGIPEKICVGCNPNFTVTATIKNTCDDAALNVISATLTLTNPTDPQGPITAQINGPTGPVTVMSQSVGVIPGTTPNSTKTITWSVTCTGPGPVKLTVTGLGDPGIVITAANKTVVQLDDLLVDFLSPANNTKVDTCQQYPVTFRVTECTAADQNPMIIGIDLTNAPNVEVVPGSKVHVVTSNDPLHPLDFTPIETAPGSGIWYFQMNCICACCYADITWQLQCTGSGMVDCTWVTKDTITAFAFDIVPGTPVVIDPALYSDSDTLSIQQMYAAELEGNLLAYEGTFSNGNFEGEETINSIAVGEYFTVVGVVQNLGEATATNVHMILQFSGPAELVPAGQSLDKAMGNIGCHGSAKTTWTFRCTGEGTVTFQILNMTGTDANTGLAIPGTLIDVGCPIYICQVAVKVTVIQPLTDTDFVVGDTFTVKAQICNQNTGSDEQFCKKTLTDVVAILHWAPTAFLRGEISDDHSACFSGMRLVEGQINPIELPSDLAPGECAEVTWQVQCCRAVDVTFWIEVINDADPEFEISSTMETIRQHEPGGIDCDILSPNLRDYDLCFEMGTPEAYVATGQEFAVTAKLFNTGELAFTIDTLNIQSFGTGSAAKVAGPDPALPITLGERESVIVNWTMVCTKGGTTIIEIEASGKDTGNKPDSCESDVVIQQYPSANLDVSFTGVPTGDVTTGTTFQVTASVTNVGEADATTVVLTLALPADGSVLLASGTPNITVGTLTGHTVHQTKTATWTLSCQKPVPSTITVTSTGFDEYGYVVDQICASELVAIPIPPYALQVTCCQPTLHGSGVTPIRAEFLGSASVTVNQVTGGTPPPPPDGTVTVNLEAGWNLVSWPWYITPTSPSTIFAGILPQLNAIYAYNRCTDTWDLWMPGGDPLPATNIADGVGYWLNMASAATLTIPAGNLNPAGGSPVSYPVCPGWNLVGFKNGSSARDADAYFAGINFVMAYTYDNGLWLPVVPNTTAVLTPGMGYWVAVNAGGTIFP